MRSNNFDGLRLGAAVLVIVGHAWVLTGTGAVPRVMGVPLQSLGLYVFFSISGYLIAQSWDRDPRLAVFLRKRVLRIFPALVLVVVLAVALIGPLVTSLPLSVYFSSGRTWSYLANAVLVPRYDLPGVFTHNPHSAAVNGALWTLGVEFCCYLATAALGLLLGRRSWIGFVALAVAGMAIMLAPADSVAAIRSIAEVTVFFAVGALYFYGVGSGTRLPLLPLLIALPVAAVATSVYPASSDLVGWLVVPYAVLAIGSRRSPVLGAVSRWGDFSYGIYLWGFLAQQLVLHVWPRLQLGPSMLVTLVASTAAAVGSWLLVERRALAAKVPVWLQRRNANGPAVTAQ